MKRKDARMCILKNLKSLEGKDIGYHTRKHLHSICDISDTLFDLQVNYLIGKGWVKLEKQPTIRYKFYYITEKGIKALEKGDSWIKKNMEMI